MIEFCAEKVSDADLIEAANQIFTVQEKDFEKVKSEKWYQTIFHAITLNQDGKKYAVRGISSLAKLQQLFMDIYVRNYRKSHEQLDAVIEIVTKNSKAIKKLYGMCILSLEEQESLAALSAQDAEILALFLGEYRDENGSVPIKVREYNRGVLYALNKGVPSGSLDNHQIRRLNSPKVIYRCFMEQCAIDGTIESQEWSDNIYEDLKDFELSENTKKEIKESVLYEAEIAGIDYFISKYSKYKTIVNDKDFEIDLNGTINLKEEKNIRHLNIEKREHLEISYDCAQIYFKDCYAYDSKKQYIESSSYVLYSEGKRIIKLHKSTGAKNVLLENIKDAAELIINKKITTYYDAAYYVIGNDLYFMDLDTLYSKTILHIPEEMHDGSIKKISGLAIYNSKKCVFKYGYNVYVVDLEEGITSIKNIPVHSESGRYTIKGDYLYYIESEPNLDNTDKCFYIVKRYSFLNGQSFVISKNIKEYDFTKIICEIESEGMYGKYYYCVIGNAVMLSPERYSFTCAYIDTETSILAECHPFYIWNPRIYQIEQYNNILVYVNADKDYSLIAHDFLHDKKRVLKKKYGEDEKASFFEKFTFGKSNYQKPNGYMRLGKWIWILEKDKWTPEIISF